MSLAAARIAMRSIVSYSKDKGARELAEEALRALEDVEKLVGVTLRRREQDNARNRARRASKGAT